MAAGRAAEPTAVVLAGRTRPARPERGGRAGDDGPKQRQGAKLPLAVATLGQLVALVVTPAHEQERAPVGELAAAAQEGTGDLVEVAFVAQGDPGEHAAEGAAAHGSRLAVVNLPEAKRGVVLLPRRWVVERSNAWLARCRRLARDDTRLPEPLKGWHCLAFALRLLSRFVAVMAHSA